MKKTVLCMLVCSISLFAAAGDANMAKMKQKANAALDADIKLLQDAKTCVDAAQTMDDIKACKDKAKIDAKAARSRLRGN